MRESILQREPRFHEQKRDEQQRDEPKPREGIVVSTVMRLTTSDGKMFEDAEKAIQHEAFYQILKLLVKNMNWPDNEESASFALKLARHYRDLLPLLEQLRKDAETLDEHLGEYQRAV